MSSNQENAPLKAYVLIEDGVVIQKQYQEKDGFIEAPLNVVPGYLYDGQEFTAPPLPTPDLKAILSSRRYEAETGGIEVGGVVIQTDRESRANLMAAHIMAKEDSGYTVTWKTQDGFTTLDAATILTISDAVRQHIEACFVAEASVVADIDAENITTVDQVIAAFDAEMAA